MSVSDRWRLPSHAPFLSVPDAVLSVLAERATPTEERIMLRILAAWRWKEGLEANLSMRHIGRIAGVHKRTARAAIYSLTKKGLLDFWENGHRKAPLIGIAPLIILASRTDHARARHSLRARRGALPGKGRQMYDARLPGKVPQIAPNELPGKLPQPARQTAPDETAHLGHSASLGWTPRGSLPEESPEARAREGSGGEAPPSRAYRTPEGTTEERRQAIMRQLDEYEDRQKEASA